MKYSRKRLWHAIGGAIPFFAVGLLLLGVAYAHRNGSVAFYGVVLLFGGVAWATSHSARVFISRLRVSTPKEWSEDDYIDAIDAAERDQAYILSLIRETMASKSLIYRVGEWDASAIRTEKDDITLAVPVIVGDTSDDEIRFHAIVTRRAGRWECRQLVSGDADTAISTFLGDKVAYKTTRQKD